MASTKSKRKTTRFLWFLNRLINYLAAKTEYHMEPEEWIKEENAWYLCCRINSKYNETWLGDDALCRISPLIMNALRSLNIHKHPLEDTRP